MFIKNFVSFVIALLVLSISHLSQADAGGRVALVSKGDDVKFVKLADGQASPPGTLVQASRWVVTGGKTATVHVAKNGGDVKIVVDLAVETSEAALRGYVVQRPPADAIDSDQMAVLNRIIEAAAANTAASLGNLTLEADIARVFVGKLQTGLSNSTRFVVASPPHIRGASY